MLDVSSSLPQFFKSVFRSALKPLLRWLSWRRPKLLIEVQTKRGCKPNEDGGKLYIWVTNKSERNIALRSYVVSWIRHDGKLLAKANFDEHTPSSPRRRGGRILAPGEMADLTVKIFSEWADEYFVRDAVQVEVYAAGYLQPALIRWRWVSP